MRVKIGFDESSKAVTAHVSVEEDVGDSGVQVSKVQALAQQVQDEAMAYAKQKTLEKMR